LAFYNTSWKYFLGLRIVVSHTHSDAAAVHATILVVCKDTPRSRC